MIPDALISQIDSRFQYEKRAQVCLWFDEKQEFTPILPFLGSHLSAMKLPPFTFLEYDPSTNHGQIWLKSRIYSARKSLTEKQRRKRRFVIYLPLSEDRLESPDESGENHLELLTEYRIAGLTWRVAGKRPTLFSFLRQAGVRLPSNPSEQRKLWEGGRSSLLTKYVARFIDRPATFWGSLITPETARSQLLGDLDQTIFDLAVNPEGSWDMLKQRELQEEFLAAVAEHYGFESVSQSPVDWIRSLITAMALTETYLGYGEVDDYPFQDHLPPVELQQHHIELLNRWLRDSESRGAWDRWIQVIENDIDLSQWAVGKTGLSFGFPHLVRQRWEQIFTLLESAASKASTTRDFFEAHGDWIEREAEFAKASHIPSGSWELMSCLHRLLDACENAQSEMDKCSGVDGLAQLYVKNASVIERMHLTIRKEAEDQGLPVIAQVADRNYAQYASELNARFFNGYAKQPTADIDGIPRVTAHLEESIWFAAGRRAILIVDALRYDCACTIQSGLMGKDITIEALRAELPTITPIGMTALLPITKADVTLQAKSNYPHPIVDGIDTAYADGRIEFLEKFGADCRKIEEIESNTEAVEDFGDLLVIFGYREVDDFGHGSADAFIRHVDLEIQRIVRIIRKLHRWGYESVHVVTDHGFLLMKESKLPENTPCNKDWCLVHKERYALVPASTDVPLATFPLTWDTEMRVAVPPGVSFFKSKNSFSHGGASLQELIIPHLISRSQSAQEKRLAIEVVLPAYELMQAAAKVTLRPLSKSVADNGQIGLFAEKGRTLSLNLYRTGKLAGDSVLPEGKAKQVRLEATEEEKNITLFFASTESFQKGELLELEIHDEETMEQFPSGGIKLTLGRDM